MIDLRVGRWETALADVQEVSAVICDPPYGARTHKGHDSATKQILSATGQKTRNELSYTAWTGDDVVAFVAHWLPRCRGWFCAMTSDDLIPAWRDAYSDGKRLDFAPVGILIHHPRLLGDGPASGLNYLMVCRPRSKRFSGGWNCPPWYGPYYAAQRDPDQHIGGKTLDLMRKVVSDYSRPGDTVLDPVAGGATTLIAAHTLGRKAIGAEMDPATAAKAQARIDRHLRQGTLFEPAALAVQARFEV